MIATLGSISIHILDHFQEVRIIGIKIYKDAMLVFRLKITHACFHQNQVDEFYSDGHWFIASQGSAYGKMKYFLAINQI